MGPIDIFKKKEKRKEQSKCAQCFRPIAGSVYTIDNNNYCRECYNRKMAVIQQTGGQPATVTQKIPPKKSAQNKLPVAESCARCFDNIPAEQRKSGKLSDHITWKIEKSILYIQGYGTLTRDDYLTITAPAPRYEIETYDRVLPWAVCDGIRRSKYISEGCPVNGIPTHIERVVVDSEIEGLKEFLLNANDYVGVQLQSPDEYLCRISVVPSCK